MRTSLILLFAGIALASTSANDVVEGNPDASVKVTIYSDLQCGYCQNLRTLLDEKLLPKYGRQVAFIHRDLPLGKHDWARPAAMAARWIHEKNPQAGIVFRRELLAEQEHMTAEALKHWVVQFAIRNNLSEKGITDAMTDPRLAAIVDQDVQIATIHGIKKIPTVAVAGQTFSETIVYDDVARVIDQALPH
jgi:protein-disulfide isomerase